MANPSPLKTRATGYRLPAGEWFNDIVARVNGLVAGTLSATINAFGLNLTNLTTGITAYAGGGQTDATPLTALVNVLGTVGTAADSVKLPAPTKVGQVVYISNTTATSATVYGAGTDTINGVATATGVALAAGKTGMYIATTIGTAAAWRSLQGA